jgi:hypothetical protein
MNKSMPLLLSFMLFHCLTVFAEPAAIDYLSLGNRFTILVNEETEMNFFTALTNILKQ